MVYPAPRQVVSYRRQTALQGGLVMVKSGKMERGDNILWTLQVYRQPLWHNRPAKLLNSVKKKRKIRPITPFKVIQGHRGRYQSKAHMRLLIIVINSNWHPILYRFWSYRSLLFKFRTPCVSEPLFRGPRDNVRCLSLGHRKARSELPNTVNWTFFR